MNLAVDEAGCLSVFDECMLIQCNHVVGLEIVEWQIGLFNCSPFYRRKSNEGANPPTEVLPQSTEMSEKCSRTIVDGLTPVDKHRRWSNVDCSSSVTVDSVNEVIPTVDGIMYGQLSLSSSQQTVATNGNSSASSAAATTVPNNGLLQYFSKYQNMNSYCTVNVCYVYW